VHNIVYDGHAQQKLVTPHIRDRCASLTSKLEKIRMSRKNWTSEKIFTRLLNNKTQKTFWENVSELRKRSNKVVYNQAFKLANSEIDKEKIIGIYVLAQLGFDPRFHQKINEKSFGRYMFHFHSLQSQTYHRNRQATRDNYSILLLMDS
tara:strand:- start:307 stop:753 length:447 start_codon:yes stop_codon:yes gene_type:complete